ncbi:MAG: hypothetical protein IID36_11630 [Planctomycetes bacterium]|nr:hypothetical protein [Planctomycetota bacterium]
MRTVPPKREDSKKWAKQLATEIVEFVEADQRYEQQRTWRNPHDFAEQMAMLKLVEYIAIRPTVSYRVDEVRFFWGCWNDKAGNIGLDLKFIEMAIANKNKKADNYKWTNADGTDLDEKWLLIAAGGDGISTGAGPLTRGEEWATPQMVKLCRESPFDRIIFWEWSSGWYKWIKPDQPATQYRDTGNDGSLLLEKLSEQAET